MDFSPEGIEEERERLSFPHKGFDAPLIFRRLKVEDTLQIWGLLKDSAESLRTFTPFGKYIKGWGYWHVQQFVRDHMEVEERRESFVFLIGKKIVGMGSIAPLENDWDVQVALWVGEPYQGRGIGARIVATLEWYVFEVWGFPRLYYYHELTNEASMNLPMKCKFEPNDPFIQLDYNYTDGELVPWCMWIKWRDPNLEPGIFQGAPLEPFTQVRHQTRRSALGLPLDPF